MAESDQYYIEQCLNGHPDEFVGLVRRYQTALSAYLAGKLGNRSSAEEAAQETFVRAYFGLSELKKRESFYSWLLGIASRVAKEQYRNEQKYRSLSTLALQSRKRQKHTNVYALEKAVASLPEAYREVVLLRYYGSLSCSEVADRLEMPLGTVTKMLSRAYAMLRRTLGKNKVTEVKK